MTSFEQLKLIPIFEAYKSQQVFFRDEDSQLDEVRKKALALPLSMLLNFPVSKLSKFLEEEWDFNEDAVAPARNVKGAKLRINFSRTNIPESIFIELKEVLDFRVVDR